MLTVLIVFIILIAAGIALLATTFVLTLIEPPLAAALAMFLTAGIPDRISQHIENLNGCRRVVALDHQLTTSWTLFGSSVLNDDLETRTRVQLRREGIMDQPPVTAL